MSKLLKLQKSLKNFEKDDRGKKYSDFSHTEIWHGISHGISSCMKKFVKINFGIGKHSIILFIILFTFFVYFRSSNFIFHFFGWIFCWFCCKFSSALVEGEVRWNSVHWQDFFPWHRHTLFKILKYSFRYHLGFWLHPCVLCPALVVKFHYRDKNWQLYHVVFLDLFDVDASDVAQGVHCGTNDRWQLQNQNSKSKIKS